MEKSERLASVVFILILLGLPAAALGYQFVLRPRLGEVRTIDIVAAAPEAGGFQPESIRVAAGEKVRLRFSVPDVAHGIAIGPGLGLDLGQVDPGEVREVEVTFEQPGRYIYYCNTWCSPSHWRMRGVIEVYDPAQPDALVPGEAELDPVFEALAGQGVDIDAPHPAPSAPGERPSAGRGVGVVERLGAGLPVELSDPGWRRSHSPAEAWALLRETGLEEAGAWDAVAYLWLEGLDEVQLQSAATLYAKNCAACHGESGDGQGPGAEALAGQELGQHGDMNMEMAGDPAALNDLGATLGGSGNIYYAKLRRGGMGTGMPSFGPLFTPEETWALVDYIWTFLFEIE